MLKRTVRSSFAEVSVREEGLVYVKAFTNAEIGLEEAKEYHSMVAYLSLNKPHCTVIDISGVAYVSAEARKFLQDQSSEWGNTLAVGVITNSFTSKMIANFFMTVNKPSYPIRVFSDVLLANQWAKGQLDKHNPRLAS
jgi:hypothetical protein